MTAHTDLSPYDRDEFAPLTKGLLAHLRQKPRATPHSNVLSLIDPGMPANLKALLHALATTIGSARIGGWYIDRGELPLRLGLDSIFSDTIEGLEDEFDPAMALVIGSDSRCSLLATWTNAGDATYLYDLDTQDALFQSLGTLADFIGSAIELFRFEHTDGRELPDDLRSIENRSAEQ